MTPHGITGLDRVNCNYEYVVLTKYCEWFTTSLRMAERK
jgi:hypothetical protein